MPWSLILAGVTTLALAIAAGLLTYVTLDAARDAARIIGRRWRRRRRSRLQTLLARSPVEDAAIRPTAIIPGRRSVLRFGPLLGGLILAGYVNVQAPLIALGLVLAGITITAYLGPRTRLSARAVVSDQVRILVEEVRAQYALTPMPFHCLAAAAPECPEPLRGLLERAVQHYQMQTDATRALDTLVASSGDNAYLAYLAYILREAARAGQEEVLGALHSLEGRLRDRERLQQRSRVVLRMVSITIRTLQGALVAALAVAIMVPLFADFFYSSLGRQVIYVLVLGGAVANSLYFDYESERLKGGLA
ncbi:MAG: hypothetical protein KKB13_20460 [Chloroflexi bacterium]|nr:hypothetical protein [Chloroflexota bacterium]